MSNTWFKEKSRVDSRVRFMIQNKINYFQPTICPAPKKDREIESLEKAIEYYAPFCDKVILQTKYMGSYCNIYLHKDIEKTYFISRNGYRIDYIDGMIDAVKPLWRKIFVDKILGNVPHMVILEAELMPWSLLGKGLIEKEFENYHMLHKDHWDYLAGEGKEMLDKLERVKQSDAYKAYKEKPEEAKPHIKRQYSCVDDLQVPELNGYADSIQLYRDQLDIFGKNGPIDFKVFGVLKVITQGLEEVIPENNMLYKLFDTEYMTVDTKNPDLEAAYAFFEKHRSLDMEGIMVKPKQGGLINIAPALKVRTNEYLQLIYGVNFDRAFDYYLEKRRINRKITSSIKGYEYALQLLNIPYSELNADNKEYERLLYKLIDEEYYLKQLDNRL